MKSARDDLTVLVFKQNSAARTFRVPVQWISKLGLIAGITAFVAVLGVFLSVKYYIASRQALRTADPGYVQDLEQELATLKSGLKNAEAKAQAAAVTPVISSSPPPLANAQIGPRPVTETQTFLAFSALPSSVEGPPAPPEVSISIYEPHVNWAGRTLKVQFFIQYTKEDKGNQQGRIVLLARGADTLLAYPAGILNTGESTSLIAPDKGEYFSVSRIREVKADFGPMKSNTTLKEIEVFLFGNTGRLLVHQILLPGTNGAPTTNGAPVVPMQNDAEKPNE